MIVEKTNDNHKKLNPAKLLQGKFKSKTKLVVTTLGLAGLITGCNLVSSVSDNNTNSQSSLPPAPMPPPPTLTPIPAYPAASEAAITNNDATQQQAVAPIVIPSPTPWPTFTPRLTPTPWSTPTPWTVSQWSPGGQIVTIATMTPVPVVQPAAISPPVIGGGVVPVGYSPPDGVDVFGTVILRWEFYGLLGHEQYFDIKIKPVGSNNSAFVEWTTEKEYTLRPWDGWKPGLYTWQIGIINGFLKNGEKRFLSDTGRDSEPFLIKWQLPGGGGGGGGGSGGGGSGGGGGGGGGGSGGS